MEINEILKNYKTEDWSNWISDILAYKIAYPISSFPNNNDPLIEIIRFLRKNNISVFPYETALSNRFTKEYTQNIYNYVLQERLLNTLIFLSSNSCHKTLISILNSKVNSQYKGENNYLKTLALHCLAKSPSLSKNEIKEIYNYIINGGIYEMQHDCYFFSIALKFGYKQTDIRKFYKILSRIVLLAENFEKKEQDLLLALIDDKFDELFYYKPAIFSTSMQRWFETITNEDSYILNNESFIYKVISNLGIQYNENLVKIDLHHNQPNEISYNEFFNELIISFILEKDISNNSFLNNFEALADILPNCLNNKKSSKLFKKIAFNKNEYLTDKTKIGAVAFYMENLIQDDDIFSDDNNKIIQVLKILDEIGYSGGKKTKKSPDGILKLVNPS